jgi:predicted hydrocarbon binding protein
MSSTRKEFFKKICVAGACMCGFGMISMGKANLKSEATNNEQISKEILIQEWLAGLLSNLNGDFDQETLRRLIKKNAIVHYKNLKMDDMLKDYENNPEKFVTFISEKWGWKIDYNPSAKTLMADENKNYCVCPMVNKDKGVSPAICYCSEGFAEMMFSKVVGEPVKATVVSSIHRGDKSCQYKIEW